MKIKVFLAMVLLGATGLKADVESLEGSDTSMPVNVSGQPAQRDEWSAYKESHSLVLYIKHAVSGKDRCAKLRLDELNEYLDRVARPDDEENYTFVNQGDFMPKGTKLVSLIPDGQGEACDFSSDEVGADDEKFNYVVVIIPQKRFPGKYFILMLDGCYKIKAAIVVPNQ
jgi:hypothetical protein